MIPRWLEHPLTRGADLDDPRTTGLRRRIIREKVALRAIYGEWYRRLADVLPAGPERVLELGSGGGYFGEVVPGAIRSEVFPCPWLDVALDGQALPFADGSLRGIAMTNVLHHLPRPARFLVEAARCIRPGGVVAMVEPWNTCWSRFVYRRFHHEPFLPDAESWEATPGGPLSGANGALAWILLVRDRERFHREHPQWRIRSIEPLMPFSYLLSGGVSLRALVPARLLAAWRGVERAFAPLSRRMAMFAVIVLERRPDSGAAGGRGAQGGPAEAGGLAASMRR